MLNDSIINFGENLNMENLLLGYMIGGTADLMVSLGSSLRVNPAADMAM
jgi:NAD-dependent SIR2 family protein deacetylase